MEMLYTCLGCGCKTVQRTATGDVDVCVGTWHDGRVGIYRGSRTSSKYGGAVFFEGQAPATIGNSDGGCEQLTYRCPSVVLCMLEIATERDMTTRNADAGCPEGLLDASIAFFQTGKPPVPVAETLEIYGAHSHCSQRRLDLLALSHP